jgi:hypothetical protein
MWISLFYMSGKSVKNLYRINRKEKDPLHDGRGVLLAHEAKLTLTPFLTIEYFLWMQLKLGFVK